MSVASNSTSFAKGRDASFPGARLTVGLRRRSGGKRLYTANHCKSWKCTLNPKRNRDLANWPPKAVAPSIDGEAFFESLRQREEELLKNRYPKRMANRGVLFTLAQHRTCFTAHGRCRSASSTLTTRHSNFSLPVFGSLTHWFV